MNYLETLQASPVWERFIAWYHLEEGLKPRIWWVNDIPVLFEQLPESFQLGALVDWLDTQGIHVCPYPAGNGWIWVLKQLNNPAIDGIVPPETKVSRSEAIKAGVMKAFNLLEKKI